MFPLFWWGLTSIKPTSAIFDKDEVVFFDFTPTVDQLRGDVARLCRVRRPRRRPAIHSASAVPAPNDSRDTILVFDAGRRRLDAADDPARGARRLRPVAHAIRGQQGFLNWVLSQRFMPPIAIIVPLVFMFHYLAPARHGVRPRSDRHADEHSDLSCC